MTVYPNDVHAHLHSIDQRVRALIDLAPAAVRNANDTVRRQDGFSERGESAGRGSMVSSSVESMCTQKEQIEAELAMLMSTLTELGDGVGLVERMIRKWSPAIESATAHNQCTGGPHHAEWSKSDCGNWVDYNILESGAVSERGDGLCSGCRKRKERWLRANDVEHTSS